MATANRQTEWAEVRIACDSIDPLARAAGGETADYSVLIHPDQVAAENSLRKWAEGGHYGMIGYCIRTGGVNGVVPIATCKIGSSADWALNRTRSATPPGLNLVWSMIAQALAERDGTIRPLSAREEVQIKLDRAQAINDALAMCSTTNIDLSPDDLNQPNPPRDTPHWRIPDPIPSGLWAGTSANPNSLDDAFETMDFPSEKRAAWRGRGVVVAVIDSGVDFTHKAFRGRAIKALDTTGTRPDGYDDNGHGTWCCGSICAGLGDDSTKGYLGIGAEVGLLSIKALVAAGWGTDQAIARATDVAVSAGVDVISMSLGGPGRMPLSESAIKRAVDAGIVVVAAAGNDGPNGGVGFPGAYPDVVTVAACTTDTPPAIASFSSRGSAVNVSAPGYQLYGLAPHGYQRISGTSMATPLAAGAVCLIVGELKARGFTGANVGPMAVDALYTGCVSLYNVGANSQGLGVVSVSAAMGKLPSGPISPPPPPPPVDPPTTGDTVIEYGEADVKMLAAVVSTLESIGRAMGAKKVVVLKPSVSEIREKGYNDGAADH